MDSSSMPPPAPRRKDDMRKQALSGLLAAVGPGGAGIPRSVLDTPTTAAATQPHAGATAGPGASPLHGHGEHGGGPVVVEWGQYWDECKLVDLPERGGAFNVYCAGTKGPILLAVHGAGYTGLTWSLVAGLLKDRYRIVAPDLRGHGLTSAVPATDFSKQTLAEDLVALWHALFPEPPPPPPAPDAPTPEDPPSAAPAGDSRATVLVGHSMGGAVVVWTAAGRRIPGLAGCVVVDVVEGTAIAALPHMMGVIAARPSHFPTPSAAVSWALRTGMSRCRTAAAVSLPSQLIPAKDQQQQQQQAVAAQQGAPQQQQQQASPPPAPQEANGLAGENSVPSIVEQALMHPSLLGSDAAILEEEEEGEEEGQGNAMMAEPPEASASQVQETAVAPAEAQAAGATEHVEGSVALAGGAGGFGRPNSGGGTSGSGGGGSDGTQGWVWRTPLGATQPYWTEWYTGLSDALLGLAMPKMLLLAGTDRLDKALTIGQMQGKFQLVVLPTAGHAIQEDDSQATAAALDMFAQRQRVGQPPLNPRAPPRAQPGVRPVLPVVAGPVLPHP